LGMLTGEEAGELRAAGLDYHNHNVDTSPGFYGETISNPTLEERLATLANAHEAGLNLGCSSLADPAETLADRLAMLVLLANLDPAPESVPLNLWTQVPGVPVAARAERPDAIAFARLVAVARIMMPQSVLRLSAGRQYMSDEAQALCF